MEGGEQQSQRGMYARMHMHVHAAKCSHTYACMHVHMHACIYTFTSCKSLKSKLTISMKNKTNKYIHVTLLQVREVNEGSFGYYIA